MLIGSEVAGPSSPPVGLPTPKPPVFIGAEMICIGSEVVGSSRACQLAGFRHLSVLKWYLSDLRSRGLGFFSATVVFVYSRMGFLDSWGFSVTIWGSSMSKANLATSRGIGGSGSGGGGDSRRYNLARTDDADTLTSVFDSRLSAASAPNRVERVFQWPPLRV